MNSSKYASIILLSIGIFFILFIGKSIILPFVFSILFYYIIRSIRRLIDRNKFLQEKIPDWSKHLLASIILFGMFFSIVNTIVINAPNLPLEIIKHSKNITHLSSSLKGFLGEVYTLKLLNTIQTFDYSSITNYILSSFSTFISDVMLVIFYVLFLFFEQNKFKSKLKMMFKSEEKHTNTITIFRNIEHTMIQYIGIKTLISLISATICFFIMYFMNLKLPLLWATGVFVFSYIPVIGTFFAVILPFSFSIIQYGNFSSSILLLVLLSTMLLTVTNLIEPRIAGKSLNISPLVALISLSVWGSLWGFSGMIISVPLTVMIIILFANFENTKAIAILLSNDGNVE